MSGVRAQENFFSRFKTRLKQAGERDPGGRYFSILLEEVFQEAPDALRQVLFPNSKKPDFQNGSVTTELRYQDGRRADLAFLNEEGNVIGLVEVKEEDQLAVGSGKQADAYLTFIKDAVESGRSIHFAYVTKHMPSNESYSALSAHGIKPIFYSDIHYLLPKALKKSLQWEKSPVAQLFCKYLSEEGVVYQRLVDSDDTVLRLLMRQGLNFRGHTGFGKDKTASRLVETPKLLSKLLSNVEAMGIQFHQKFRPHLGNPFLPQFTFAPHWDVKAVGNSLTKDAADYDKIDLIPRQWIDGGLMYVWSEGRLRSSNCWVWFGYEFGLSRSEKSFTKKLYAGVWAGRYVSEDTGREFNIFPEHSQAQKGVQKILIKQIESVLDDAEGESWKSSLEFLLRSLKQDT